MKLAVLINKESHDACRAVCDRPRDELRERQLSASSTHSPNLPESQGRPQHTGTSQTRYAQLGLC